MNGSLSPASDIRNLGEVLGLAIVLLFLAVFVISQSGVTFGPGGTLTSSNKEPGTIASGNAVAAASGQDSAWPVCGIVTTEFGVPHAPWQASHTGIDIANPAGHVGDAVTPFKKGTVIAADSSISTGWGKHVVIDHGDSLTSLYGHMSGINVSVGQVIAPGHTLGWEGSTGWSTGPHVHFEVREFGTPADPRDFVSGDPGC